MLGLGLGLWPGGVRGVLLEQSRLRLVTRLGHLVRMPRLKQARLQPFVIEAATVVVEAFRTR